MKCINIGGCPLIGESQKHTCLHLHDCQPAAIRQLCNDTYVVLFDEWTDDTVVLGCAITAYSVGISNCALMSPFRKATMTRSSSLNQKIRVLMHVPVHAAPRRRRCASARLAINGTTTVPPNMGDTPVRFGQAQGTTMHLVPRPHSTPYFLNSLRMIPRSVNCNLTL